MTSYMPWKFAAESGKCLVEINFQNKKIFEYEKAAKEHGNV